MLFIDFGGYCNNIAFVNKAFETILKKHGYRLTKPRIAVFSILRESRRSLNPYEISKQICRSGDDINTVTVYRILDVYEKLGLVHKTRSGYTICDKLDCEDHNHCHHQFVCEGCEDVVELHFSDCEFAKYFAEKFSGLVVKSHYFEFSGFCKNCKS